MQFVESASIFRTPFWAGAGRLLVQLILGSIGAVCVAICLHRAYFAFASMNWKKATGVVVTREIRSSSGNIFSSVIEFAYAFNVGDRRFVSWDYYPGGGTCSKFTLPFAEKQFVGDEFEAGAEVDVYFDPRNPHRSAIIVGDFVWPLAGVVFGAVFVTLSLLLR